MYSSYVLQYFAQCTSTLCNVLHRVQRCTLNFLSAAPAPHTHTEEERETDRDSCTRLLHNRTDMWFWIALQATHTLRHAHTHTLTHTSNLAVWKIYFSYVEMDTLENSGPSQPWHCNTLQNTATHCNTFQHLQILPATTMALQQLQHTTIHWASCPLEFWQLIVILSSTFEVSDVCA